MTENLDPLHFAAFPLGLWQTNCYLVSAGARCWIVDAGFEPKPLLDAIEQAGLTLEQVVLTHAHVDHIAGLREVRQRHPNVPILVHEAEAAFLTDTGLNLSSFLADPVLAPEPTALLRHGDELWLGRHRFQVLHTPGHSPGGICLYQAEAATALVGDTLFEGTVGRHDFPTSNEADLRRSILEQLYQLPDPTRVLPGHMGETTIGREKRFNPFVRA